MPKKQRRERDWVSKLNKRELEDELRTALIRCEDLEQQLFNLSCQLQEFDTAPGVN